MGKSRQNDFFDRGMHRSEDDLGYLDPDISDEMGMPADSTMSGQSNNPNTATMRAKTKAQQETSTRKKRGNQPDM
ncbi:hypothetical protein [Dactylosporangium sp. CA-092794]|uniref:hypothetical protein n=1 Tax=Dactylosporangium sp. CA-092794 TaxID=3239929 RepID=UPI003D92020D